MIVLANHPGSVALLALTWVILACLMPMARPALRQTAICTLVFSGVPVLGWLTYLCGPGFGVLFLALGLSLLVWPPFDFRRRRALAQRGLR